ncbi:hypothetical protein [Acinetobacter gyllenbergii]|uniref:hypothetical protein n=1 Tax=Acinetobacter gyllenbergii TaxID=134534 RepID=UPI003F57EDAA
MFRNLIASILLVSSFNANANIEDFINWDLDQQLKVLGLVDENYKFINSKKAEDFFNFYFPKPNRSLPYSTNDVVEIIQDFNSPYYTSVTFRDLLELTKEEEQDFTSYMNDKEVIQQLCKDLFGYKYMKANNHNYDIFYTNVRGDALTSINLNNKKCTNF